MSKRLISEYFSGCSPPDLTRPGNQTVWLLRAIWGLLMSLLSHGIP